LGQNWIQTLF